MDHRAAKKYPLGTYKYAGKIINVQFTCANLVDTSCNSEEDIVPVIPKDNVPNTWLIVQVSNNPQMPTCALLVKNNGSYLTNTASENIVKIELLHKYHYEGHAFSRCESSLLADCKPNGKVILGFVGRRGFQPMFKNLQSYKFAIPSAKEAKCCQPWFDNINNPDDPAEILGIE